MLRLVAAATLAGHGLIHLMGFVVAWQIATLERITYRATFVNGLLEVGDAWARGLGIAWLALGRGRRG
jgi:hypothetical protein